MPEDFKDVAPQNATTSVSEAAIQTLDILQTIANVLEQMWEATPTVTYKLEVGASEK